MKPIYQAPSEDSALAALDNNLEAKWGTKYPLGVKFWRSNWNELSVMYKHSPEIRRMIYTTNAIENFNRQLRKSTKTKGAFVSDDALMKMLYLTTIRVTEKWAQPTVGFRPAREVYTVFETLPYLRPVSPHVLQIAVEKCYLRFE